jgi:hypothetical protein
MVLHTQLLTQAATVLGGPGHRQDPTETKQG